jgi:hypothetical protein
MTTLTLPVLKTEIEVLNTSFHVEYSIDIFCNRPLDFRTEVYLFRVNNITTTSNVFSDDFKELMKMACKEFHATKIEKESKVTIEDDFADVKATLDEDSDNWDEHYQNQEND